MIFPSHQGRCYSYYGNWSIKDVPTKGVHYFMLDEHINKSINKQKDIFSLEIRKIFKEHDKEHKSVIKKTTKDFKSLEEKFDDLKKFVVGLVESNELKVINDDKKPVKRKKSKNK